MTGRHAAPPVTPVFGVDRTPDHILGVQVLAHGRERHNGRALIENAEAVCECGRWKFASSPHLSNLAHAWALHVEAELDKAAGA